MNNLKRVLSLGLSGAMLAGMVTIGASAANKDFTDADEIQHTEAVDTLVALNVINGKDDGSYDPTGSVTRGEMAKLITVALNGGKAPVIGTKATPTYTDIDGHWAESYIEYCSSLGVISGRGDGTFAPDATVTGSEAAKMLLVAMGWDSTIFNFTGIDWEINVNTQANTVKLYDELDDLDPSAALDRDSTAQMVYNGILAPIMEKSPNMTITNGSITWDYDLKENKSLFTEKFDGQVWIDGTFAGNSDSLGITDGYIRLTGGKNEADSTVSGTVSFPYAGLDISNIGEKVKVLFKDGKGGTDGQPDSKDTIYGVFNTGATTVYEITLQDIQDVDTDNQKIKFGDTKYEYVTGGNIVTNYVGSGVTLTDKSLAALDVNSADSVKFVCDNDGKIKDAYVTSREFDVVAAVSSDKVQLRSSGTLTIADNDVYDDIAKGDIVMVTTLYNATATNSKAYNIIEKAELMSGTVTKFYKGTQVAVDGTSVSMSDKTSAALIAAGGLKDANGNANYNVTNGFTNSALNNEYEFVMYGKRYIAAKALTETSKDYAIILAATDGDAINGQSVQLLLADGSKKTYSIHVDSLVGDQDIDDGVYFSKVTTTDLKKTGTVGYNTLVSYSIENDGKVKMTAVANVGTSSEYGKYIKSSKSITKATAGTGTAYVTTSDAVAFVYTGSAWGAYKASALEDVTGTTKLIQYATDSDGKVVAFAMQTATLNVGTSDFQYMYITAAPFSYTENDKKYTEVSGITVGGEAVTLTLEGDQLDDANAGKMSKGNFIQYKVNSDGYTVLTNITELTTTDRVTEYDSERSLIVLESAGAYPVASDVVIINVNTEDVAAGTGTGINTKDPVNTGYQNVVYLLGTADGYTNAVLAIFVDDNKQINKNTVTLTGSPTAAAIMHELKSGKVVLTGTLPSGVTVADGETLQIETLDQDITVKKGGTLILNKDVAYDLSHVKGEVGATVKFTSKVLTGASAYTGFYKTAASTPVAASAVGDLTSKTYVYVADVDTDAEDTTAGFLLQ